MDANADVAYLRSLPSIRERCTVILNKAIKGDCLPHFRVDLQRIPDVIDLVQQTMKDSYPEGIESVPFHSRWRHFEPGNPNRVAEMCENWTSDVDKKEKARRLIDLVVVSVLLDAGAGNHWKYKEPGTEDIYTRSEGLGIASFHMFLNGSFSNSTEEPHRADAPALIKLANDAIAIGFQTSDENPLVGCQGRTALLQRLGQCLEGHPEFFGSKEIPSVCRPGYIVDYLWTKVTEHNKVSIHDLWHAVMEGLQDMWPAGRTTLGNCAMGDVWPHSSLPHDSESSGLVSFHKLSQWLTYSMIEPLEESGLVFTGMEAMTGLPEYRNGGLFVDVGVLIPKDPTTLTISLDPSSEVIIEWRALTVALLDIVYDAWKKKFNVTSTEFPLVKLLEAGTWKAGRVIAQAKRNGPPPISIVSDGTIF